MGAVCGAKNPKQIGSQRLGVDHAGCLLLERGCFPGVVDARCFRGDAEGRSCFRGVFVKERGGDFGIMTRVSIPATASNAVLWLHRSCQPEQDDSVSAFVDVQDLFPALVDEACAARLPSSPRLDRCVAGLGLYPKTC